MSAQAFTVEAGRRLQALAAVAPSGGYDVEVHGPNGFYRRLAGAAASCPDVTTTPHAASGTMAIALVNPGPPTRLTVNDNVGRRSTTTYDLPTGSRIQFVAGAGTRGWYDVTITSSRDSMRASVCFTSSRSKSTRC